MLLACDRSVVMSNGTACGSSSDSGGRRSASAVAPGGGGAQSKPKSWKDQAKVAATQGADRFTLTQDQRKAQKKLKKLLPRMKNTGKKAADSTGLQVVTIVTDLTPKRPIGKKSKKQEKRKHTSATFHVTMAGASAASGATGLQAKQVLAGQLEGMLKQLKHKDTDVQFVKSPKKMARATQQETNDALLDKYEAIIAPPEVMAEP